MTACRKADCHSH